MGVIYAMYCLYYTQSPADTTATLYQKTETGTARGNQGKEKQHSSSTSSSVASSVYSSLYSSSACKVEDENTTVKDEESVKVPIRVGPSAFGSLTQAARQAADAGEVGAHALAAFRKLLREERFSLGMLCIYMLYMV